MATDGPINEQLGRLAQALDEVANPIGANEIEHRGAASRVHGWPLRWRIAAFGVALALSIAVGIVVVRTGDEPPVVTTRPSPTKSGRCQALPRSPIEGRDSHTAVWTGKEMIIWGGEQPTTHRAFDDGAAWSPQRNRWRRLPKAPVQGRWSHAALWTGTEMLVWGGNNLQRSLRDGAAYNPTTNRWRRIPAAPMPGTAIPAAVWTGREMLVLGGLEVVAQGGQARRGGAAYNPKTNRWRVLPAAPFEAIGPFTDGAWTGHDALFVANSETGATRVAIYHPDTDRWTAIPTTIAPNAVGTPVWDGHRVLVFVGGSSSNFAVDLKSLHTGPLADGPNSPAAISTFTHPIWAEDQVIFWASGATARYVPKQDRWTRFSISSPFDEIQSETAIWTGHALVAWGGFVNGHFGEALPIASGVAYRPASPHATDQPGRLSCPARQRQAKEAIPPRGPVPKPADIRVLVVDASGTASSAIELTNSLRSDGYVVTDPIPAPQGHLFQNDIQCRPEAQDATFALTKAVTDAIGQAGASTVGTSSKPPARLSTPATTSIDCLVTLGIPCIPDNPAAPNDGCHSPR